MDIIEYVVMNDASKVIIHRLLTLDKAREYCNLHNEFGKTNHSLCYATVLMLKNVKSAIKYELVFENDEKEGYIK